MAFAQKLSWNLLNEPELFNIVILRFNQNLLYRLEVEPLNRTEVGILHDLGFDVLVLIVLLGGFFREWIGL